MLGYAESTVKEQLLKGIFLSPYTSGVLFLPGYWVQNRELLALALVCLISSSDMNTECSGPFLLDSMEGKGLYLCREQERNQLRVYCKDWG